MAKRVIIIEDGEQVYPLTTTENVFDNSGIPISEILENKAEKEHEHDYVTNDQIMPLPQMLALIDGKANLVHTHSQYLTEDDLSRENNIVTLQSLDRLDQIQTGIDSSGNPIYENVIRNHTVMNKSTNQYSQVQSETILDLPDHTSRYEVIRVYLYLELAVDTAKMIFPSGDNIKYNIDMENFELEMGKLYELCFTTVNDTWICEIKVYQ